MASNPLTASVASSIAPQTSLLWRLQVLQFLHSYSASTSQKRLQLLCLRRR